MNKSHLKRGLLYTVYTASAVVAVAAGGIAVGALAGASAPVMALTLIGMKAVSLLTSITLAPVAGLSVLAAAGIYTSRLGFNSMIMKRAARKEDKEHRAKYPGQHMTEGEKALSHGIFGNEIPQKTLDRLTKHFLPQDDMAVASVPLHATDRIDFYGETNHEADYSRPVNGFNSDYNSALFIHEMTHIWQNKHPLRSRSRLHDAFHKYLRKLPKFARYNKMYDYDLASTPRRRFKNYGIEQQASILQDYTLRFIFNRYAFGMTPEDAVLKKVVEDRFPAARATRLKHEAHF